MPILSNNPMWEAFGLRALPYALYGGADIGECVTTVEDYPARDVGAWGEKPVRTGEGDDAV